MLKTFNKKKKTLPKKQPQCYVTANLMYTAVSDGKKMCSKSVRDAIVLKKSMAHLYKLIPSITVVELNIQTDDVLDAPKIRKEWGIKNKFWLPRLFNHSFNILILKDEVIIAQSWFRFMDYKIIKRFKHTQFIEWLDTFRKLVKDYKNNPGQLFQFFDNKKSYTRESGLMDFIKTEVKHTKINFSTKYSYQTGDCQE
jgi:hypothetical protein